MANIDINLGQATLNALNARAPGVGNVSMADKVDLFLHASYDFGFNHSGYSNAVFSGTSLNLNYADGATSVYSGVTLANPNATSGQATATKLVSTDPSSYRLTTSGNMTYQYAINADGSFILQPTGGAINDVTLQTLLPSNSPNYDATLGNETVALHGAVSIGQSGDLSGSVTSVTARADKLVVSSTLTGNFGIGGNVNDIGQGLARSIVSGIADSWVEKYTDGSSVSVTNLALAVNGDTVFNEKLLLDGANLPSDDIINVTLAGNLATPWLIAAGAGNDTVTLKGGGATLSVNAGSGNDRITLGDSGHGVDGGSGVDTAIFGGARSAYTVSKAGANFTVQSNAGGVDTLANVERLQFADAFVALDTGETGIAGQAYRLYQAAFNRTPDAEGLGFWIHYMDGGMSLNEVANFFVTSPEFVKLYGANLSNADMIGKLYNNVLHRAGEADGVKFWTDYMENGGGTQAKMLAFFGQSPENQAALIGTISNGFEYTPSQG
jgi:hypothetical protein